jgi:hypothetical protein
MKRLIKNLFLILLMFMSRVYGQAPAIEWQNTIGGTAIDYLYSIQQTDDQGFILGGSSYSLISGDKTQNSIALDYWIVKTDSIGDIQWQNSIGGISIDNLMSIDQTSDGGYILGGYSLSEISYDKTEPTIGGTYDYWIVKIDATGNIEWQNTIGGIAHDYFEVVKQTSDGGYIVGGWTTSGVSGDKTEPQLGDYDFWLLKLNESGEIMWQNTIGGNLEDKLHCIEQTNDGGFIIGGSSKSGITGDKTEANMGDADYWVIKLNEVGEIQWQNTIGGNNYDELHSIYQTDDGGYMLGGFSVSGVSGDKIEGSVGSPGYWILKLNSLGNIVWQNTIMPGYFGDMKPTNDGGIIIGGYSFNGIYWDKTEENIGGDDYWVVKLDSLGNVLWDNTIGGTGDDNLYDIIQTADGGYMLAGYSNSGAIVDKSEEVIGFEDYWIVKLACEDGTVFYHDADGDGFGNEDDFINSCSVPPGYILDHTDCDDSNPLMYPGATEICNTIDDNCNLIVDEGLIFITYYLDFDSDGFGNILTTSSTCDSVPPGYVTDNTDCNDLNAFMNPEVAEICNGLDDNCNLLTDEGLSSTTYYLDADSDAFGNVLIPFISCSGFAPAGFVEDSTDCNDLNNLINPSAIEICNTFDDNCNLLIDEGFPSYTYYLDADTDGYGNILFSINSCDAIPPTGYVINNTDCDDFNNLIHEPVVYFADIDGDLYGDELNSLLICSGSAPSGYVSDSTDCDDSNVFINPVSNELCNAIDDNCNLAVDEGLPTQLFFIDTDNDDYGNSEIDSISCLIEITGYVTDSTDCDDANPAIYPGALEIFDGIDNNCNKLIDEGVEINSLQNENGISVYPNPATDKIIISINSQLNGNSSSNISICDISGKNIFQIEIKSSETEIDVAEFVSGIYFVKILVNGTNFIQPLIIE